MEEYRIKVVIDEVTTEYCVVPKFTHDRDNEYEVFCEDIFVCLIWFEEDINGIVWRADHRIMRQEIVDQLGEGIEKNDL
jgi:hypothetical protein